MDKDTPILFMPVFCFGMLVLFLISGGTEGGNKPDASRNTKQTISAPAERGDTMMERMPIHKIH